MSNEQPYGPQGIWILLIILAAIAFGATPVFVRHLTEAGTPPEMIAFYRYALTALVLLPFMSLRLDRLGATVLGLLAGAAIGLGWIGYVLVLGKTKIAVAGIYYMTYPLFAMLFALALTGHRPGLRGSLAVVMILVAAWIALTPGLLAAITLDMILMGLAAPVAFGFAIAVALGWLGILNPLQKIGSVALGASLALAAMVLWQSPDPKIFIAPGTDWANVLGLAALSALIPSLIYAIAAPRIGAIRTATAGALELPAMA
ncbi:MAG: DMT family transporter, partial [Pseudomonadota bacterium]